MTDPLKAWKAALAAKNKAARNRRGTRRTALQAGRTLGVRRQPTPKPDPELDPESPEAYERDRLAGIHRCTERASWCGGYECVCGDIWLISSNRCATQEENDDDQPA